MASDSLNTQNTRTELSQSIARIIIGAIVLAIVATAGFFNVNFPNQELIVWMMFLYVLYALIINIAIKRQPKPIVWRRGLSIIIDLAFSSIAISLAGSFGGAFYPVYLWIIVGNGLRFGVPYLFFSMIIGVIGFAIAVISSDHWGQNSALAAGLLIGLVLLPMFYVVILRELEATNRNLQIQKEAAEQADIAKSRFLAAASHDLRQPLQAQALFVAELYERLDDPEKILAIVEKLDDSIDAMREQFNALLDISKLDAGVVRPNARHFRIDSLLQILEDEYTQQAKAKGLELLVEHPDATVYTDPGLLDSVLRNLVVNAVRYTKTGKVIIDCCLKNDCISIEVRDTGPGIERRYLEDIFQEFYQIDNPGRNRDQGLGLGLSVVRRIANLLECPVQVSSIVGKGSCFYIDVPLGDKNTVEPEFEMGVSNNKHVLDGTRVIVIDDERAILEAMDGLLESWGCHVHVAGTGEDMLFRVSEENIKPDIIISDYRLPSSMTGVQAVVAIREHLKQDIPAILITGDIEIKNLQDVQESAIPFLHKPIQPGRLRTLMHHLLSTS